MIFRGILLSLGCVAFFACGGPRTPSNGLEPVVGEGDAEGQGSAEAESPSSPGRASPVAPVHPQLLADISPVAESVLADGNRIFRGGSVGVFGCVYQGSRVRQCPFRQTLPGSALGIALVRPGLLATGNGGEGLFLLDITTIGMDPPVGHLELGGAVGRLERHGLHVLAAVGHRGIAVLDLIDPENPHIVSRWASQGYVRHVRPVEMDRALVAEGRSGLAVLDFSDPSRPHLLGRCDTDGEARAVDYREETAFVADMFNGVVAVDFSDGANPRQVGRLETRFAVRDVLVWDDVLLIGMGRGGFSTVDISDPTAPRVITHIDSSFAVRFARSEGGLIVARTGGYTQLFIMNDPAHPQDIPPRPRPPSE